MSDEWDSYFSNVNDKLASLFVDLGIRNSVPDPLGPHLTWCWIYMNQPRPDRLSSAAEAPMLGTIEDDLVGSLKERATFVGRITTAGRRELYFYDDDTTLCEDTISRTMRKHAAYRFDLGSQRDEPGPSIGHHCQLEMIPVHIEAARRVRRQPGIVVRLFDQVLRAAALVIKPEDQVDGLAEVGHQHYRFSNRRGSCDQLAAGDSAAPAGSRKSSGRGW